MAYRLGGANDTLWVQNNTPPSTVSLNIVSGWLDELARQVPLGR